MSYNKNTTPLTDEQIKELNDRQISGKFHPYTCDRKHKDCEIHSRNGDYSKDGVLIATKYGWICPCGKYKQSY